MYYTIVGDGPEHRHLQSITRRDDLEKRVTLTGEISKHVIRDMLQKNDIFLMTSITDEDGRCEAQGIVTVEAEACGLPVVSFRNGCIPDTILDGVTGYLAADKGVDGFVEKVINKGCHAEFSLNAR